jgi:glycosyltransferase involved in cell wall biosynthesis
MSSNEVKPSNEISVLMPCAGNGAFFEEALLSALAQEGVDIRVFVLDNASASDRYAAVVRRINDSRVNYIRFEKRLRIGESWQRCLEYAGDGYFCFLHDDDTWAPSYLRKATECFVDSNVEAVLVKHVNMNAAGMKAPLNEGNIFKDWSYIASLNEQERNVFFLIGESFHMSAVVFRRKRYSFNQLSGFNLDQRYVQNYVIDGGLAICYDLLCYIRQHSASMTAGSRRYDNVLERDSLSKINLYWMAERPELSAVVGKLAADSGEFAFRLFRAVFAPPIRPVTYKKFSSILFCPRVARALSDRLKGIRYAVCFGRIGLSIYAYLMDIFYLMRALKG